MRFGMFACAARFPAFAAPLPRAIAIYRSRIKNARIDAVIWRGIYGRLRIKTEEGLEVVATGGCTTFAGKPVNQNHYRHDRTARRRRAEWRCSDERSASSSAGLFAPERKRPLPYLPRVIASSTAATGR